MRKVWALTTAKPTVYALRGVAYVSLGLVIGWLAVAEFRHSRTQARLFTGIAETLTYRVDDGASPATRFPEHGPYNVRLGYTRLADFTERLAAAGYVVQRQARPSPQLLRYLSLGGSAPYEEKAQAGFTLRDRYGDAIFQARFPQRLYADFQDIPPLVVDTLLFIENRELLDGGNPRRNPAIEWDRFGGAVLSVLGQPLSDQKSFGGSTLATQIEKYRHSPGGLTVSPEEKLRQIVSASVKAYRHGPETARRRQGIVLDYLNSTPQAGRPGYGEVIGLGDALWAWFGTEFAAANAALATPRSAGQDLAEVGLVYRQVLSLLLAQRRPSYFLRDGQADLAALTDHYLALLVADGVIDAGLARAAAEARPAFRPTVPPPASVVGADKELIDSLRVRLLSLLGVESLYELDRLDLTATGTVDSGAQQAVADRLAALREPKVAAASGLIGRHRIAVGNAPEVVYSLALYARNGWTNELVLQTDNADQAFSVSDDGKMDLGSTAKLRTLVSYLEIVAELHRAHADKDAARLEADYAAATDPLSRWALDYLRQADHRDLRPMLTAAMERRYSASPGQRFLTGRSLHTFANADPAHNGRRLTVWEAFRYSTNLVFIRMMRDIVDYEIAHALPYAAPMLADGDHPLRQAYLARFADAEGSTYLRRFHQRYAGASGEEALARLVGRVRTTSTRLAVIFRSVRPAAPYDAFASFMRTALPAADLSESQLWTLYLKYAADRHSLADRGYLAGVHPLELWLVAHKQDRPAASLDEVLAAGYAARQQAYAWLFKTARQSKQDRRIRMLLEEEAFDRVHARWQRLGYPFPKLVPSLATAIGTSADNPGALAELMGIILNGGIRLPMVRIRHLEFARDTPYETVFEQRQDIAARVLPAEVADTLREALVQVVEQGTARGLANVYVDPRGVPLVIGGKTGTGDDLVDQPGGLTAARNREVGRSAAFVFFLGDRHFGTITAHIPGAFAGRSHFTSSLLVQVLRVLAPEVQAAMAPRVDISVRETAGGAEGDTLGSGGPAPRSAQGTPAGKPARDTRVGLDSALPRPPDTSPW